MEALFSEGAKWTRQQVTQVAQGEVSAQHKKEFFTVRAIIHWNSLPRDMLWSPSLEVFKMLLVFKILAISGRNI